MRGRAPLSPNMVGSLCALASTCFFSFNDSIVKHFSDDYALHQIILTRSVFGLLFVMVLIAPFAGGLSVIRTTKLKRHLFRGLLVVTANMCFFLGLAVIPLAEAVAIFFIAPLLITAFSVVFLGETVGPRRWGAVIVGFIGVLIVMRPGADTFQFASLLPIMAAFAYAGIHTMTRSIGTTESAATMTFYIQVVFIGVCLAIGLAVGDGRFGDQENGSLAFLLRAWVWPSWFDLFLMTLLGFGVAFAGLLISQAYKVGEPGFVASFEYVGIPLSIAVGYFVFGEVPTLITLLGVALILGSGLYAIARAQAAQDQ